MSELLIGCGHSREKKVSLPRREKWDDLYTLDRYPECSPDVTWDLEKLPYPFKDNRFEEIHAYCVLEHLGSQGDWKFFFDQWAEFSRISTHGATFHAITPLYTSPWAWGDPSHRRIIGTECLSFLSQKCYEQIESSSSPMSDFRWYYKADWELIGSRVVSEHQLAFILRCNKEGQK